MLTRTIARAGLIALVAGGANAQEMRGVSKTEIKIGQTMPYSGPVSAFSMLGKSEIAYFQMVNDKGGINGRKVNLISYDDGYVPPKTVEQTRKMVENDGVTPRWSCRGNRSGRATNRAASTRARQRARSGRGSANWDRPHRTSARP